MHFSKSSAALLAFAPLPAFTAEDPNPRWHPPANSQINDLDSALNSDGVYGFIFDSSETPDEAYGTYNWCNMPHVRATEYIKPPPEYELQYVELVSYSLQERETQLNRSRSTATTSARPTLPTPFPWSPTAGTATTRACIATASHLKAMTRPALTGRATHRT
ncbi:hypothetical protein IMZ48_47005 [Candidatus Bathyarchaeota archaeon]|nr:hypothetical protein [Candidatus Bathyarchaeota archaeon]